MPTEIVFKPQRTLAERMDPAYWSRRWEPTYRTLDLWRPRLAKLGDFIGPGCITYGQVGRREYDPEGEVLYLQARNISRSCTGIDPFARYARVRAGGRNDPPRSRLAREDLLLVRSGVASIGRAVAILADPGPANISQHICRIRLSGIDPACVAVFLICRFGQEQIRRMLSGVGTHEIDFDEVRSILVPLPDETIVQKIRRDYEAMRALHDEAILARRAPIEAERALQAIKSALEQIIEKGPEDG